MSWTGLSPKNVTPPQQLHIEVSTPRLPLSAKAVYEVPSQRQHSLSVIWRSSFRPVVVNVRGRRVGSELDAEWRKRRLDVNRACSLLALLGDQHHQIHQPIERECPPEPLEPVRFPVAALLDNASFEQGANGAAVGPVGLFVADSDLVVAFCPVDVSEAKIDTVAHFEGKQTGLLVEAVVVSRWDPAGHGVAVEDEAWVERRVPKLDLEAFDARQVVAAVRFVGVGLEPVDEVLPNLVGLGVPLGVDADTEESLLIPDWEDLAAELAVDLCQVGLA